MEEEQKQKPIVITLYINDFLPNSLEYIYRDVFSGGLL